MSKTERKKDVKPETPKQEQEMLKTREFKVPEALYETLETWGKKEGGLTATQAVAKLVNQQTAKSKLELQFSQ